MDILTRITFESKVVPGAVATFRRASAATRAVFVRSQAKYRAEIREIIRARKPLDDEFSAALEKARAAAKIEVDRLLGEEPELTRADAEKRVSVATYLDFPDDKFIERAELLDEQERIENEGTRLSVLRALLVSIEGFTLGGVAPDADLLIAEGPIKLTEELAKAADEIAGLGAMERGESPWPGISVSPVAGPNPSTTAPNAENASAAA